MYNTNMPHASNPCFCSRRLTGDIKFHEDTALYLFTAGVWYAVPLQTCDRQPLARRLSTPVRAQLRTAGMLNVWGSTVTDTRK